MNRFCIIIFGLISLFYYVHSYAWLNKTIHTKHPDMDACLDPDSGVVIKVGETILEFGKCSKSCCNSDYEITYTGCAPIIDPTPRCIMTEVDLKHPYPLCCRNIFCPTVGYLLFSEEQKTYTLPKPNLEEYDLSNKLKPKKN